VLLTHLAYIDIAYSVSCALSFAEALCENENVVGVGPIEEAKTKTINHTNRHKRQKKEKTQTSTTYIEIII
jgi:hypothetical protein